MSDDAVFSESEGGITKEWMRETLKDAEYIIAHNGIKFDFLALKLFGVFDYEVGHLDKPSYCFGREVKFIDTLVLSRLLNPDRYLGHSIDSWGERVKELKTDYRKALIDAELLTKDSPPMAEFSFFNPVMLDYCIQDTNVNALTFKKLLLEMGKYRGWSQALRQETKLADYGVKRELLGFDFDKELAVKCVEELQGFISEIRQKVEPHLPPRKLTQTQIAKYTLPKTQFKANGEPSKHLIQAIDRMGGFLIQDRFKWEMYWEGETYSLPREEPLLSELPGKLEDLDHIKMHLINLGWDPLEWRERDVTRDTKKQLLPYEKQVDVVKRYVKQTLEKGLYKDQRLQILEIKAENLESFLLGKLDEGKPFRVPTSPTVRVGVEKELCPNLVKLGDKVSFAKDFSDYLTYRHRLSSIAGGDIEDMDFDSETPNTGFLANYREEDGRIPTPAIEIGASTNRYRHVSVANLPRPSSMYGAKIRSLFGAGKGFLQFGYDFSSLENRVQAGYIKNYPKGEEIGKTLTADKPLDSHTRNSELLGISRTDAKSVSYALLYGAALPKIVKMLNVPQKRGAEIFDGFWEAMLPLKMFKQDLELQWEQNGKEFLIGIDGRKIRTRSRHSLLNAMFQSAGVICAKYTAIFLMEYLENLGYITDPFVGKPDVCSMIEYHDEQQLLSNPKLFEFKMFNSEEEAKDFVKNWEGEQLSSIGHGKKWFVILPNPISKAITEATTRTEKLLNLQFKLGFEYIVGRNWAECH